MPYARVAHIEYQLPEQVVDNEALAKQFPDWSVDKIFSKTGIAKRHVAAEGECASDLAVAACNKLFDSGCIERGEIDFLLFCTQSPDHPLPATACLLQHRLGLKKSCGAFDFNQGCSGFVYGLGIAKGLIESGQARNVLLLTADTYSKYINPADKSVRTLFGDAAAATLISASEGDRELIGSFEYGTDGAGGGNLIVPAGGSRTCVSEESRAETFDESGNRRSQCNLYMNGPAIFEFSMQSVPAVVNGVLARAGLGMEDVDVFALHQANRFMLDSLRKRLGVPKEKFLMRFEHCGNTVSCTIPIALKEAALSNDLKAGDKVMAVGFGVGYSWAGCLIRW